MALYIASSPAAGTEWFPTGYHLLSPTQKQGSGSYPCPQANDAARLQLDYTSGNYIAALIFRGADILGKYITFRQPTGSYSITRIIFRENGAMASYDNYGSVTGSFKTEAFPNYGYTDAYIMFIIDRTGTVSYALSDS